MIFIFFLPFLIIHSKFYSIIQFFPSFDLIILYTMQFLYLISPPSLISFLQFIPIQYSLYSQQFADNPFFSLLLKCLFSIR